MMQSEKMLLETIGAEMENWPPVERWHPDFCGDSEMEIRADGRWYHQGSLIKRPELVRLFSRILRLEPDGSYVLVTPVEKMSIKIYDAPFFIGTMQVEPAINAAKQTGHAEAEAIDKTEAEANAEATDKTEAEANAEATDKTEAEANAEATDKLMLEGQNIFFETTTGARFLLDQAHALEVRYDEKETPRPYVMVRKGLKALISRAVFYDMVAMARPHHGHLWLESAGAFYGLGAFEGSS